VPVPDAVRAKRVWLVGLARAPTAAVQATRSEVKETMSGLEKRGDQPGPGLYIGLEGVLPRRLAF
jgi:hypothetical protein